MKLNPSQERLIELKVKFEVLHNEVKFRESRIEFLNSILNEFESLGDIKSTIQHHLKTIEDLKESINKILAEKHELEGVNL